MEDINEKWDTHISDIEKQIHTMWNFIIFKDFYNQRLDTLNNTITNLNEENAILRLKRSLEDNDNDNESSKKKKKHNNISIKKQSNRLKSEYNEIYNKHNKYNFLNQADMNRVGLEIYSKMNTINDIIQLQYHPNKFDFINNDKFIKLYNIIPALEELNKIIGMNEVKEKLFNSICYFLHSINNKEEMNHVMIMGAPGVGKTTIAKIIGDLYLKLGFLNNNKFIVARRSDLIGKYLGHTSIKTQEVIDSAMGGVLFIDEVYSLGSNEKKDSFAKECIDTINLNMSRTDVPWLLIVGGYKEEIETSFLSYNIGLERRFTVKLEIKEYSANELFEILMKFIKEDIWEIEKDAITVDCIKNQYSHFKYSGGDMRKIFQLAKENYSVRHMKESTTLKCDTIKKLSKDDFVKSLLQFIKKEESDKYFHQSMYS
jgi:hypothetical protein